MSLNLDHPRQRSVKTERLELRLVWPDDEPAYLLVRRKGTAAWAWIDETDARIVRALLEDVG